MKKTLLSLLMFVALNMAALAVPLSGTYYIPSGTPSYPSLATAFAALNTNGVAPGGVTFLVAPGYTESGISLILSVASAGAGAPIIFKRDPAGLGANPKLLVTAGTSATTDGGIIIAGTDYVTFNQIDIDASAQTTIEWGYALVKASATAPFDGCQHVTINGCNITLNKANTNACSGIYSGNHTATATTPALAITLPSDACNACMFDNNRISNVHVGVRLNGYNASSPNFHLYDHNNEIGKFGKNVITNFTNATLDCYGIYCAYQDSITVMNDSIYSGTGSLKRMAGIVLTSGTGSNAEVANNIITVSSSGVGLQNLYGIWNNLGNTPTLNCIKIHDNIIANCTYLTATTGPMYGIFSSASPDTIRIYNNEVYNSTYTGTATTFGIRSDASGTVEHIYNNNVHNMTNTSTANLQLIYTGSFPTANVYLNKVHDCSSNGGVVSGLYSATCVTWNLFKNEVYNLNSGGTGGMVYGVNNVGATTANIYNNFVYQLTASASLSNPAIIGLNLGGGTTTNVFFNTVYLDQAVAGGATFGSCALYSGTATTTNLRDNILVNNSAHGASGFTVAHRRSTNNLATYSSNSNFNDFYAGTPGPNNLIFYDGTTTYPSLSGYQGLVTPRDGASFTENPPFINVTVSPYNIHIRSGVNTLCESGGQGVSSPVNVVDDFDSEPRYPNSGYPNNIYQPATAPDVGADEFAGGLSVPPVKTLHIEVLLEGLYDGLGVMRVASDAFGPHYLGDTADLVSVSLHKASSYSVVEYLASNVKLSTAGVANVTIPGTDNKWYYITINHRNSIETTTADSVSFAGSSINYSFNSPAKAYGFNMASTIDGATVIYSGDSNQDMIIDGGDLSDIANLADVGATGFIPEDLNEDGLVDASDLSISGNNADAGIGAAIP